MGKVLGTYLPAGETGARYLVNQEVEEIVLTPEGVTGDRHATFTMPADSRTTNLYPKGTVIRNNRQWTAISPVDVQKISKNLGADVGAGMIGMNLLIDGIERFSGAPTLSYSPVSHRCRAQTTMWFSWYTARSSPALSPARPSL